MLRSVRVTRRAVFCATVLCRSLPATVAKGATARTIVNMDAATDAMIGPSTPNNRAIAALRNAKEEREAPAIQAEQAPEPEHQQPKFLFQGRRGSSSPEYYVARGNTGHPDPVAELLCVGRADPEWMWLKLLCFLCVSATLGTTVYGYLFAEHVKYFKDEPWSPFTY
ncbi:hypothetical protein JKF63_01766 [Porcisia hertigi]|uniref:Transmembrane protein n=1 Tax=Porcisia hertigi TaxID=2761500 RepID=A0A836HJL4_9TRYP|nr:hypothetical protein JKF63_01766 [Porcisia hertigi]